MRSNQPCVQEKNNNMKNVIKNIINEYITYESTNLSTFSPTIVHFL